MTVPHYSILIIPDEVFITLKQSIYKKHINMKNRLNSEMPKNILVYGN